MAPSRSGLCLPAACTVVLVLFVFGFWSQGQQLHWVIKLQAAAAGAAPGAAAARAAPAGVWRSEQAGKAGPQEAGGGKAPSSLAPAPSSSSSSNNSSGPVPSEPGIPDGARKLRELLAARSEGETEGEASRVFPPGRSDGECVGGRVSTPGVVAAVFTLTYNRAAYLKRMLAGLLDVHSSSYDNQRAFPLYVSQDGEDPGVQDVVYTHLKDLLYLQHKQGVPPEKSAEEQEEPGFDPRYRAYWHIAHHYQFVLHTVFDCFQFDRIILLEDDMQLSPDFFSYFEALAPVLDRDPMLWCVSSWNDHGQAKFVSDARRLYRTDYFPGLGWMTNRRVWDSVKAKWPPTNWDDWMRLRNVRKDRQCIRPEVCRNFNFGKEGSSEGEAYDAFLAPIRLNTEAVPWRELNLTYLEPNRYHKEFLAQLRAASVASSVAEAWEAPGDTVLHYRGGQQFKQLAGELHILGDRREGTLRTAYMEVVTLRNSRGALLFLAPPFGDQVAPQPDVQ